MTVEAYQDLLATAKRMPPAAQAELVADLLRNLQSWLRADRHAEETVRLEPITESKKRLRSITCCAKLTKLHCSKHGRNTRSNAPAQHRNQPHDGYKANKLTAIDPATGQRAALFHPRTQVWDTHFSWDEAGIYIVGITPVGRATVDSLRINRPVLIQLRSYWIALGLHPPQS